MAAKTSTRPRSKGSASYQSSGRRQQVRIVRPAPAAQPAPAPAAQPAPSQKPQVGQPSTSVVSATKIERSNYQSIILMEYVAAVILTATTPLASTDRQPGASPYMGQNGKTIAKLAALTLLYLILAMLSVGGRGPGRFAAWFGGLILIVDGMYEASNLVKDVSVLTGGLAKAAGASAPPSELPTAQQQAFIEGVGPAALNLPPAVIANAESSPPASSGSGPSPGKLAIL